ncbi:MAG: aldehyde dehydrogenase family protein [Anaerovoracaceae bacterium]
MKQVIEMQRKYYNSNITKDISFREAQLKRLYNAIKTNANEIYNGLKMDLNKSEEESYLTEIQITMQELRSFIKNINKWNKKTKVRTPLSHAFAKSMVYKEPYGNVLILAPWNYPFQLTVAPLIGAIAGGNCVTLKTSRSCPNVSNVIKKIITETFDPRYIYYVPEFVSNEEILEQKYDLIFFTGSQNGGRSVLRAASNNLTPVVLELGGKSPCIIDETANLDLAAKRIAWGKYLNSGQTCVAPDYILIEASIKDEFIKKFRKATTTMYGDGLLNENYVKIINEKRFNTIIDYINKEPNRIGGRYSEENLKIEPTIFPNATFNDDIMGEEIFGPIMPVIEYTKLDSIITKIKEDGRPLACYMFSSNKDNINRIINEINFGGGCINDVIMHVANDNLPFGGVGASGMGQYHGRYSFDTFTRNKAIESSFTLIDVPLRYPPYSKKKFDLIKKILR